MYYKKLFTGLFAAGLLFMAGCKKDEAIETTVFVSTSTITDVTSVSATAGGDVDLVGTELITERGVCWSTTPKPTTANNKIIAEGKTTGNFSVSLTELPPGAPYYVRAYVINNGQTYYGNEVKPTLQLISNGDFELPNDPSVVLINSIPNWKTDETDDGIIGRGTDDRNPTNYIWTYNTSKGFYQVVGQVPAIASDFAVSFLGNYDWTEWGDGYETTIGVIFSAYSGDDPKTRVPIDTVKIKTGGFPGWGNNWTGKSGTFSLPAASEHAGKNLVIEFDVIPYSDATGTYDDGVWYNFDNVSVLQSFK